MTAFKEVAVGSGSYHRFTPGKWFRLTRHEQRNFNRQFLLTAITHSGYNGEKTPPHSLPDKKTISTIKSVSSKGGEGSNELRFEDKKGAEYIDYEKI